MKKVYVITAILASLVLAAAFVCIGYGINKVFSPPVVVEMPTATPAPTPEVRYIYPRWEPSNIEELKKTYPNR